MKTCLCHPTVVWRQTPPSWGTPCDINAIYTSLKSTFSGLQFRRWQYGSIFIRLPVIASEIREKSRNFKRIWPYSSSRSSKVIDLGVNLKCIYDFLLVINCNFNGICYRFQDIHAWRCRKLVILPTRPLSDAPLGGTPLNFCMKLTPQKNYTMGLPYSVNFIILTSTVYLWYIPVTDTRTDGR